MTRYITGLDDQGRSAVLKKSDPPRVWTWLNSSDAAPHHVTRSLTTYHPGIPEPQRGFTEELWTIRTTPEGVTGEDPGDYDYEPGEFSLDTTPPGILRWSVTRFGPGYASKLHFTDSIDLDMCIEGELTLVLETEELHLKPGDSVMLPRLMHSWRTETGGAFAYVMLSPNVQLG